MSFFTVKLYMEYPSTHIWTLCLQVQERMVRCCYMICVNLLLQVRFIAPLSNFQYRVTCLPFCIVNFDFADYTLSIFLKIGVRLL